MQANPTRRCQLHSRVGSDLYGDLVAGKIKEAGVELSAARRGGQGVCICLSGERDRSNPNPNPNPNPNSNPKPNPNPNPNPNPDPTQDLGQQLNHHAAKEAQVQSISYPLKSMEEDNPSPKPKPKPNPNLSPSPSPDPDPSPSPSPSPDPDPSQVQSMEEDNEAAPPDTAEQQVEQQVEPAFWMTP